MNKKTIRLINQFARKIQPKDSTLREIIRTVLKRRYKQYSWIDKARMRSELLRATQSD